MSSPPRLLVVENDPDDDVRRLGDWLRQAGAELDVVAPHKGVAVPADPAGYDGLVVLGGAQTAYPVGGMPGAPWFGDLTALLRLAVGRGTPTLGVCLGGQLLAVALGGRVEPCRTGPERGAYLVAKRDVAEQDPLFATVPFTPDVYQWHTDEITVLPPGATLLAASTAVPIQAFRAGTRAWGLQFHIECDFPMLANWAAADDDSLADAEAVLARCADVLGDVEEVWRPFAGRFVALAAGRYGGAPLPVITP